MRVKDLLLLASFVAALGVAGPASAATVKAGVEAWQRGDHNAATAIWRRLATKGDPDAAFNLGQAYRLGRGVPADSGQAKAWFERAAGKGHLDAMVSLGILLFDAGNRTEAMRWLMRAAERGEPRALLVAGTALFNGDGVKRDPVLAYAYVSRAAAQGLAPAKATLADLDKALTVDERRRGVAMALTAARKAESGGKVAARQAPAPAKPVATAPAATAPKTVAAKGGWRVQLGAFSTQAAAAGLFAKLSGSLPDRQAYYVPVGKVVRLQAGPFESRAAAAAACTRLKPQPCFAVEAN